MVGRKRHAGARLIPLISVLLALSGGAALMSPARAHEPGTSTGLGASSTAWRKIPINSDSKWLAVSCASASFCTAVGGKRAVRFNGRRWSSPRVIDPHGYLRDISCAATDFCVATDLFGYAVTFDGTSWSEPTLVGPTASYANLASVSCASVRFCIALDYSHGDAYTYDGRSWSKPRHLAHVALTSVSCVSRTFCLAAGDAWNIDAEYAFVFHGSAWKQQHIGKEGATQHVSCGSATFCMLTDQLGQVRKYVDGAWTKPKPLGANHRGYVWPVACTTHRFCAAAPQRGGMAVYRSGAWTIDDTVDQGHPLTAVSCTSRHFCLSVDGPRKLSFVYTG
jgi:hypothetical protein